MLRSTQRSRGTGPRATVKKSGSLHRRARALAGFHTRMRAGFPRHATLAGDRPPRYVTVRFSWLKTAPVAVGRGPVLRHAPVYPTLAGETLSDARVASEGPRATVKMAFFVGRGPVPRECVEKNNEICNASRLIQLTDPPFIPFGDSVLHRGAK